MDRGPVRVLTTSREVGPTLGRLVVPGTRVHCSWYNVQCCYSTVQYADVITTTVLAVVVAGRLQERVPTGRCCSVRVLSTCTVYSTDGGTDVYRCRGYPYL